MICPYCNASTSLVSRQRSVSGANILVVLCSKCEKIVGIVNDPNEMASIVRRGQ